MLDMFSFLNDREVANNFRDIAIPVTFIFCFFFGIVMFYLQPRNKLDWCWTWVIWSFVAVLFGGVFGNQGRPLAPWFEILIWINAITCMAYTAFTYVSFQVRNREI